MNDPQQAPVLKEVENMEDSMETYASIMATQKPNPRGPGYIKLYILSAVVFLCSTMNGFDSSLMGSINALPKYIEFFGLPENGNAGTGIVFAIFQVGQMCGALFIWMTDWYGRTWHIFLGCLGVCIGTIITALASNLPTFIAGRFLLSFFATCAHTGAGRTRPGSLSGDHCGNVQHILQCRLRTLDISGIFLPQIPGSPGKFGLENTPVAPDGVPWTCVSGY
jgi:uncharacterized membrane protein